jgi:hypothetical protein
MKNTILISLSSLAALLFAGCASYKIQPIPPVSASQPDQGWSTNKAGYVFYQPELYFLVVSNKTGSSVTPVYLPNPAKPYRVTTKNHLAKSDFEFKFNDGWQLSSIADKADNSTIANTIAGELGTVVTGLMSSGGTPGPQRVFLVRPKYDANGLINGFTSIPIKLQ